MIKVQAETRNRDRCLRPIPRQPSKKGAALRMGVQELLKAHPDARQKEYCQWWEAEYGMPVSQTSIGRAIHAIGWMRETRRPMESERAIEEGSLSAPKLLKQALKQWRWGCSDHTRQ